MKKILVANPKGGSGKTTIATNLAGYFANLGHQVVMADLDRQLSSTDWVTRRPAAAAKIQVCREVKNNISSNADWLIMDSPGGFRAEKLSDAVKSADCVIVPIQPSVFDITATEAFLNLLIEEKAIRKQKTFVALVGMRVNSRTNAALKLSTFMQEANFPVLTSLRNAQCYVNAAESGLSIFEMRPSLVTQDLEQWQPLTEWIMDVAVNT
jgi:chromosome partitioning protein